MKLARGVRRPATRSDPEVAARLRVPARHGHRPAQIGLATAVAVLSLLALLGLTLARSILAERAASPLAAKLAGAERIAYYVVPEDSATAPIFRLAPGDDTIKLITHLVLPAGHAYRDDAEFRYGVRLTLSDLDGRELWTHELRIRSRQSKSEVAHGWRQENAFLLDDPGALFGPRELTDDRLTRVHLPATGATGDRMLRLTFIPDEPEVDVTGLARVYVRHLRPVDERTLRQLSLTPEAARGLVDHLTYRDWEQLTAAERMAKLSHVWERLAAIGEAGVDYQTLSIYWTGFRLPRDTKTDARRLTVDPVHSLAVNVVGPTELTLDAYGPPEALAALEVRRRSLDGSEHAYAGSRARERSLAVPAGVHTLTFASDRRVELELEVAEAGADRVGLREADRPKRENEGGQEVLEPDERQIMTVRLGEYWAVEPRWAIVGPDDEPSTRIFRFDIRVVAPIAWAWPADPGPPPQLELCFLDAEGSELRCEPWTGQPSVASKFEGLRDVGVVDEPGAEPAWLAVSEPQTIRTIAPREAAWVTLRSPDDPAVPRLIVRGYGYWPEVQTELASPFREHVSEPVIWRYPPLERRTWFPLRPDNFDDLDDDKAIVPLVAQVRLQPRGEDGRSRWIGDPDFDDRLANELAGEDGFDPGPWVGLDPRGTHRRRLIAEQLDEAIGRALSSRWSPGLVTELRAGRSMLVDFSATGPGAPELHWHVQPNTLGRSVRVRIDDQTFEHRVAETRGRWRLPVATGRHRITLQFDAPVAEWDMWLDRPVLVGSPPVSRRRVVHELTSSLVFPLDKPGIEAVTVNLVVYLPRRRERAELALKVDDGRPKRRVGVPVERLSIVERTYVIDADVALDDREREVDARAGIRFVDLEGRQGPPLETVTVQITLGEDVVPGRHEVRVELVDGGRVWVRAFHRGVADRSKPAASWTEATRETGEVTP